MLTRLYFCSVGSLYHIREDSSFDFDGRVVSVGLCMCVCVYVGFLSLFVYPVLVWFVSVSYVC